MKTKCALLFTVVIFLLIGEVVGEAEAPEIPDSPSRYKEPPTALIKFLDQYKIRSLLPIPGAEQLKTIGLTQQAFEGYKGAAWIPNTSDPSLLGKGPLVVSNGLFRVAFDENYLKAKMPTFYIAETLDKQISSDEALRMVEARFGGIKLSATARFYGYDGLVRFPCWYGFKLDDRYYLFMCTPEGVIENENKRSDHFTKTVLIFQIEDKTPMIERKQ